MRPFQKLPARGPGAGERPSLQRFDNITLQSPRALKESEHTLGVPLARFPRIEQPPQFSPLTLQCPCAAWSGLPCMSDSERLPIPRLLPAPSANELVREILWAEEAPAWCGIHARPGAPLDGAPAGGRGPVGSTEEVPSDTSPFCEHANKQPGGPGRGGARVTLLGGTEQLRAAGRPRNWSTRVPGISPE